MIAQTDYWVVLTTREWEAVLRLHPNEHLGRSQPYQHLHTTLEGRCVCVVETMGM